MSRNWEESPTIRRYRNIRLVCFLGVSRWCRPNSKEQRCPNSRNSSSFRNYFSIRFPLLSLQVIMYHSPTEEREIRNDLTNVRYLIDDDVRDSLLPFDLKLGLKTFQDKVCLLYLESSIYQKA